MLRNAVNDENTTTTISCFRPDDGSVGEEDFESDQLYHSEFHSKRGGVAQSQVSCFVAKEVMSFIL